MRAITREQWGMWWGVGKGDGERELKTCGDQELEVKDSEQVGLLGGNGIFERRYFPCSVNVVLWKYMRNS